MLGLGATPATPKNALHSAPRHQLRCSLRSATASPQNQLHLANASQKKLHGGLRGAKQVLHLKSLYPSICPTPATPLPQLRKINCTFAESTRPKICMVGCDVLRGVGIKKLTTHALKYMGIHVCHRMSFSTNHLF